MPFVLMPVFTFLLMSFAYHSDMMLIKGANSNVSGFSLSIPLLTAIKRTLSSYAHSRTKTRVITCSWTGWEQAETTTS